MFQNANVLFQTRFIDGVSSVIRTAPSAAVSRAPAHPARPVATAATAPAQDEADIDPFGLHAAQPPPAAGSRVPAVHEDATPAASAATATAAGPFVVTDDGDDSNEDDDGVVARSSRAEGRPRPRRGGLSAAAARSPSPGYHPPRATTRQNTDSDEADFADVGPGTEADEQGASSSGVPSDSGSGRSDSEEPRKHRHPKRSRRLPEDS